MKIITQLFLAASTFLVQVFVPNSLEDSNLNNHLNQPDNNPPQSLNETSIDYNQNKYTIRYAQIDKPQNLKLFNNLSDGFSSQEFYDNSKCSHLINGNFYSENDTPIGWVLSQNKLESNYRQNKLLNGFLLISKEHIPIITQNPEFLNQAKIGVQSGPILINESEPVNLVLKQDKAARRSFAFLNDERNLYFGTITTLDNQYIGPLLKDLPQILDTFSKEESLFIHSAINLDGGSASAFITPDHKQTEITKVGSFFCLTKE